MECGTRPALTHKFNIDGTKGFFNVGLDKEGQPIELFITISKNGSTLGGFADAFARLVSIALQNGISLYTLCHKMRGLRFEPLGTTTSSAIPQAQSIVDYIFTWLDLHFKPQPPPNAVRT